MNSPLRKIPVEENSVDAIFCYGAIFLDDLHKVLTESYRALKKGGKIYFNANGLGWMLNLWLTEHNKASDYNPKETAFKAFRNTFLIEKGFDKEEGQQILESKQVIAMAMGLGFKLVEHAGDGEINISGDKNLNIQPFFKKEYYGFEGIIEYLFEKE